MGIDNTDYRGAPSAYNFASLKTEAPTSALESRIAALEERCERLERAQGMALWHVEQFVAVNMPPYRSLLNVGPAFVPAHITAALRHLCAGVRPTDKQVLKAIKPTDTGEG